MSNLQNTAVSEVMNRFIASDCRPSGHESQHPHDSKAPVSIVDPAETAAIELKHQGYTRTCSFAVLPSRSAPRLLLPLGDPHWTIRGARVYTPYAWKAKMMKGLLTTLIRTRWRGWSRHRVLVASTEPLPIEALVTDITGEPRPVFALSLGNRIAIKKLTVQVMRPDGEILGYIKLPLNDIAIERIRHEADTLGRLWNFRELRPYIPKLLYAGQWMGGWIFFQSPLHGEPGPTDFTIMHQEMLEILWNAHRVEKPGISLVEQVGTIWEKAGPSLGDGWEELGRVVLRRAARDFERLTVRCGISHGDFAPWNTRVQGGKLLLFDWESTTWETPNSWDIFHFALQTEMSLKRHARHSFPVNHNVASRTSYLLYLLIAVVRFLQEENWVAIAHCKKLIGNQLDRTRGISQCETGHP